MTPEEIMLITTSNKPRAQVRVEIPKELNEAIKEYARQLKAETGIFPPHATVITYLLGIGLIAATEKTANHD